jgi:hypothetical protein
MPEEALRVPGGWGSHISSQSFMKMVKLSALGTSRFYPEKILPVLVTLRGWVDRRQ